MPTIGDILTRAARSIGFIGQGQTLNGPEGADALSIANEWMAAQNQEEFMFYRVERTVIAWPASVASKTLGATGFFTTIPRPDRLLGSGWISGTGTSQIERPVNVLQTWKEYQAVTLKNMTSTLNMQIYYDPTYPDGTLYPWPIPNVNLSLTLYTWLRFTAFAALTSTISMPDGFLRMLRLNLACELGAEFSMPVPSYIEQRAREAKGNWKSLRITPLLATPDPMSNANPSMSYYDYRSDLPVGMVL